MAYPSTLETLPVNSGNSTPMVDTHPELHNDVNAVVNELQTKVGVDGSAVDSTHDFKLSGVASGDKAMSLTGTETATNKRLTSPKINEDVAVSATATEINSLVGINNAWTAFTPVWTNLTVGNGTNAGRYKVVGKIVVFQCRIVFGNTTSMGSTPTLTLPVAKNASYNASGVIGTARILDNTTALFMGGITGGGEITVYATSGAYATETFPTSTIPFTWTTSDAIYIEGLYEAA